MSNRNLSKLNDHLFAQLERLNAPDLSNTSLEMEIEKAKAITGIASQIIGSAKVTVDAMKLVASSDYHLGQLPEMIGIESKS